MTNKKARSIGFLYQALLLLMAALLLYLGISFIHQVGVSQQRKEEARQLEQKIVAARQKRADLETRREYALSDAAVEEWARIYGLTRPDEVPVVLVEPPAEVTSAGEENPEASMRPDSPRQAWWELFFGQR